ncbi:glycine/D-amino acid oxidase-like deaminating enzyme [Palleronia aestuarii]|uniref:Glycine/D-amino acid oxidase-like deaminating enzyme n=1 Tax=Palleronia aestuarii TaxID=568105 RepID=A0A2W7N5E3_9RHOB|nr:FAD-binding oxidoreductase [Palleronia aestuarii]PZX14943.1 glycine/D-amino acid oxidase-like deaminating enzyme [Palleronia aestuarii]
MSEHRVPEQVDVAIIGGGIAGISAAIELAARGRSVALFEKGRVGGEQSSRNWGWIRKLSRDPREMPLMIESTRIWSDRAPRLDADVGFGTRGITYLAQDEAEMAARQDWLDAVSEFQLDARMMGPAEADAVIGRDDRRFAGAIHMPSDMSAEPRLAIPAMARLARDNGVTIAEGCAVRGVETRAGRISAVITEQGRTGCEAAVLAGGAWCRTFLENLGIHIPQLAITSSVLRTEAATMIADGPIGSAGASIRRRKDGGYTIARSNAARFDLIPAAFRHFGAYLPLLKERWRIVTLRAGPSFFGPLGHARWSEDEVTPFERHRVLDPAPDTRLLDDVLATARDLYPALQGVGVAERWAGMIDVTPDEIPMIDEIPGYPGFFIAAGMSGHGFGLGPGVGRLAADLVDGRHPIVDPTPFALARFRSFEAA